MFKDKTIYTIFITFLCAAGFMAFPSFVSAQYHTSTAGAINIGENSATLSGYVNAFSSNATKRWFQWGFSPDSFSNETNHLFVFGVVEAFKENISGLSSNTTYFFRTVAQNPGENPIYGEVKKFTTKKGASGEISISTNSISSVGMFSATVTCFVDPQGNGDTQRWVDWGSNNLVQSSTEKKYQGFAGSYSVVLNNLSQNTVYYFRCAARGTPVGTVYGNILNFKTNANNTAVPVLSSLNNNNNTTSQSANTNTNSFVSQSAVTKPATNIVDTGATLNAVALSAGSLQTYGWFEWGGTPNLGYTSIRRYLGAGTPLSFSETISGLTPGTTYFFKPIIENQNGTAEGVVFSFHTTGTTRAITPVSGSLNTASAITSIIKKEPKPVVVVPENKKRIKVEVIPNTDTASPNERISETIQIENTTNIAIKEVVVRAVLPCTAAYISTGGDEFVENGKMLTHKIGILKPNEKISLLFWMKVGADVADKTPMETIAVVNWEDKIHPNDTESVGRGTVTVDTNKISKESAAVGAAKNTTPLFPENLKSWGAIIGFLFLLFAAYLVYSFTRRKNLSDEGAEQDNLLVFQEASATYPTLHATGVPLRKYNNDPFITEKNIQKDEVPAEIFPATKNVTEKGIPPENLPI